MTRGSKPGARAPFGNVMAETTFGSLQRIHPVLWPLQLVGAVTVFTAFLTVVAVTYALVAGYETLGPGSGR
jgi:predicted anti-sigma-YlaC factor YlaD